jgi:hypothetical protein
MLLNTRAKKINLYYMRSISTSNRTAQSSYFQNQGHRLTPFTSNQSKPVLSNKDFSPANSVSQQKYFDW